VWTCFGLVPTGELLKIGHPSHFTQLNSLSSCTDNRRHPHPWALRDDPFHRNQVPQHSLPWEPSAHLPRTRQPHAENSYLLRAGVAGRFGQSAFPECSPGSRHHRPEFNATKSAKPTCRTYAHGC